MLPAVAHHRHLARFQTALFADRRTCEWVACSGWGESWTRDLPIANPTPDHYTAVVKFIQCSGGINVFDDQVPVMYYCCFIRFIYFFDLFSSDLQGWPRDDDGSSCCQRRQGQPCSWRTMNVIRTTQGSSSSAVWKNRNFVVGCENNGM